MVLIICFLSGNKPNVKIRNAKMNSIRFYFKSKFFTTVETLRYGLYLFFFILKYNYSEKAASNEKKPDLRWKKKYILPRNKQDPTC